ncbi:hypothetical protein CAP48_15730 [Advenella sp. S44]|nr:hypothetical protein CAP48_15730 [Advenella sp. S44]
MVQTAKFIKLAQRLSRAGHEVAFVVEEQEAATWHNAAHGQPFTANARGAASTGAFAVTVSAVAKSLRQLQERKARSYRSNISAPPGHKGEIAKDISSA